MINLLYVEDQQDQIEPFTDLLHIASLARKIPATVQCVSSLEEIGPDPQYDALLIDLDLGLGIAHTINWIDKCARIMPAIIILTASEGLETECLRKGAEDYWHKPDVIKAPEIFIDAVNKAIVRHGRKL